MIRLIAFAAFAIAVATSAQAMSAAPLYQPDGMTTQVAFGCGPFRDANWWCLRGQKHHTPSPQVRPVGCRARLPSVDLLNRLAASKLLFLRTGSAFRQAQFRAGDT
jgi:hypothetical protein